MWYKSAMGRKSRNSTPAEPGSLAGNLRSPGVCTPGGGASLPGFAALALLIACGAPNQGAEFIAPPQETAGEVATAELLFRDVAAEVGLDFVHQNGMGGAFYYPEMMGAGAALFDYDRDGDLDIYLVQGHPLGPGGLPASGRGSPSPDGPSDRLFRNELENGRLTFTDVTAESALAARGYGMGVTVFDADNDGWPDLYLTNLGRNQLWRNRGKDGQGRVTFEDITHASGSGVDGWSVPATVLDIDRDGRLDLFVGQYLQYDLATDPPCRDELGVRNYCGPLSFRALPDRLLWNRGPGPDGVVRFLDISQRAGIKAEFGRALGTLAADFNGDGWSDLYVANDGTANQLWMHRGAVATAGPLFDGPLFENRAVLAGAAVNGLGTAEASMGLAAGDLDGDGDEDLLVTHLRRETNTLYLNDGSGQFTDVSAPSGLGPPSLPMTSFGVGWLDLENDGDLDLLTVNGAVKVIKTLALAGDPFPLHQANQLFRNRGDGTFEEIGEDLGPAFALSEVSRGAAFGDLDNDGDTDVVILNNNGPVRLLENRVGQDSSWLGLRLFLAGGGDALGARAGLVPTANNQTVNNQAVNNRAASGPGEAAGETVQWRRVATAGSYGSSNDPRLLFGLGTDKGRKTVQVEWPDGRREVFDQLTIRTWQTLVEGRGERLEDTP